MRQHRGRGRLFFAKSVANRPKDGPFLDAMIKHGLVKEQTVLHLSRKIPGLAQSQIADVKARIKGRFRQLVREKLGVDVLAKAKEQQQDTLGAEQLPLEASIGFSAGYTRAGNLFEGLPGLRLPKFSTLAIITAATLTLPFAALFAVGRVKHWSLNVTTCMPIGFYQCGPVPATLKDGDRVYFCPPVHEDLHMPFAGPAAMLENTTASDNPAMHEAVTGLWLDFESHGKWHCADDLMPFAKEVVATAGQSVKITKQGVIANGKLLPNSRIVTNVDGIPVIHLPIGTRLKVPKGYFWDYAQGTFAFTSAYYGPVPVENILGSLQPALVIPGSQHWYTDKIQTR